MWEKLKSSLANDAVFTALIVILVGVVSFGLGRMSVLEQFSKQNQQPVLRELATLESSNSIQNSRNTPVVGSKSGTKYHLPDCPGARQMKPENRIEFASIEAARAAGYSPAGNCPGLE